MAAHNPIDYSKTQRIVLLIDLSPIHQIQNPNNYILSILTSAKTLLNFSPLSHSLSSFKLFFSSLSPLLSSSTLLKHPISSYNPNSLSFNHPNETLDLLSQTLKSLPFMGNSSLPGSISRASLMSSSIAQVIHDYAWDLCDFDSCDGFGTIGTVRSNLVVLFSPVCRSFKDLCEFMGFVGGDVLSNYENFVDKFRGVFGYVRDAFVSRDIHFTWVDVKYDVESSSSSSRSDEFDEYGRLLRLFQSGVKGLGWGFVSSNSIILGSALVSFGLIYPMIGVSSIHCDVSDACKKISGHLNLEILDVNGKPLDCKYCDVELLDLKTVCGNRPNRFPLQWEYGKVREETSRQFGGVWEGFIDGLVKIEVKALHRSSEHLKIEGMTCDVVIVHELLAASKKNKGESYGGFFADKVLDMLSNEMSESIKRKSPPLWQILLCFLYRRGYSALVSLSNVNGGKKLGVLKPFNIHSAFLLILKNDTDSHSGMQFALSEQILSKLDLETGDNINGSDIGMDSMNGILGGESRRKNKKHLHRYKDLSWSSFCKAAYEHCDMELEEAYFCKGCDSSKKLKFLKCWMKQVAKNGLSLTSKLDMPEVDSHDPGKPEETLGQLHQESEQPCSSFLEDAGKETQMDEATASFPQAAEAFFSNLSERILHGIESGVDLVAFAQRVVHSCIHWLSQKIGVDTNKESRASVEKSDCSSSGGQVVGEIIKILLKDPKELVEKDKDDDVSSKAHDDKPSRSSSEDRVRQYELQILFRMEILKSEVAVGIMDSTKHKFVKQICLFLEFIQCNMEDGFFGDFNLNDYVGRTISSRYAKSLPGVVHRIYDQMDLLLFDEEESPNPLLNSEDSSQSWRIGDNDRGSEHNSTEDSFSKPLRYNKRSQIENRRPDDDYKLVEARERRERALRFASFTRRAMPELQRVWAPKQSKLSRSNSDTSHRSKTKRKSRRRESYDVVCETPTSGTKKCLFPPDDIDDKQEHREQGGCSSGSVYKALFQDDSLHCGWKP